ncbi:glycine N-acyltransferase-like protein 3 [Gopherus flavomarginatus]|uniref:glycine N-acyltransferase-like protein 3 n=1 Tax=Gopherus flavomarginatus TaxID=286002 RepID=UPI0021CC1D44|nr:glycine N-acyltransferase-like protein 3 [Gopherus flavomarginatus]
MLILNCSSKLRLLEGTLRRSLPDTLLVYGTVMTINRGNPAAQEVLVDSWPEFKVILTRPRREVALDDSDLYTNTYTVYYRDLGAYRALLTSAGAVNWGQSFRIFGLQDGVYEACKDFAEAKGIELEVLRHFTCLHPDPSSMPEIQLDPAMRLSSLDVSHADLLNEKWSFGGNEKSRKYLATLIRHFPSICLLDAAGHPVSWIASYPFGAMGPAYTLHEHRRRSYMVMLTNLLAKRLHALGYPSYGYVDVENYPMQRLQESQGFQRLPNLWYFILHNPVPGKAPTLTPRPAPGTAPALDSALRLSSLDISHADLLNETRPFLGTEQGWRYLANLICRFSSFFLLDA